MSRPKSGVSATSKNKNFTQHFKNSRAQLNAINGNAFSMSSETQNNVVLASGFQSHQASSKQINTHKRNKTNDLDVTVYRLPSLS